MRIQIPMFRLYAVKSVQNCLFRLGIVTPCLRSTCHCWANMVAAIDFLGTIVSPALIQCIAPSSESACILSSAGDTPHAVSLGDGAGASRLVRLFPSSVRYLRRNDTVTLGSALRHLSWASVASRAPTLDALYGAACARKPWRVHTALAPEVRAVTACPSS
jgi:hypothetical protein